MQNTLKNKISVLQVDDHELVREGIARLLNEMPDMVVLGQLSSGEEILEYISQLVSNKLNLNNKKFLQAVSCPI